ncbi:hypothetical protein [Pedobacter metabolipauper]|uniref:Uncharacterized protein n=1 Tax=Pedobacter metabolipauper TaxID=425513 RepID=A0A4R6SVB8_9SPHI|nr:hypothetical protein [Pedobacter metabolipauper]TDQ08301.1 hypothetical protein ATK78_2810 [Pedobacter metabolipauper]
MYLLIIITVLAVILGFLIRRYFRSEGYFLSRLPEKYKSYPSLNENIKSASYQVKPLFTGARPKTIYRDSVNNVIIVERMEEFKGKEEYQGSVLSITYYRINYKGEALDSLNEKSDSKDFGYEFSGHLLYEDGYSNYLRNGSKAKLPYKDINKDLTTGIEALTSLIRELREQADAVKVDDRGEFRIYAISIDGQVQRVFSSGTSKIDVPYKFQNNFHLIAAETDAQGGNWYDWQNINSPIHIDYFLKQEYTGTRNPSPFSPAPMTRPANWSGVGYFHLQAGQDTLKFKHPINYFPGGDMASKPYFYNGEWGKLDLFKQKMDGFQILTVGYDNDHVHELDGCYLVTPIPNKK